MNLKSERRPFVYFALANEQYTTPQLLQFGVAAEQAGFDGVWTSDHFQPWQPNEGHAGSAWMLLAALTQRTSRIQMGTGVTCPAYRYNPAVVAQNWASLSLLAPNRVFLGVGLGENLNEGASGGGWGDYEERACRVIEAVRIIRALWSGDYVQFKGRTWNVDGKLYDPPASNIPLYIAATAGPRSARIAGVYGDGLVTSGSVLRSTPSVKADWEAAIRENGEDPQSKAVLVESWAMAMDTGTAREAAEKWRFLAKAWKHGYHDNISPVDIEARAQQEIAIDDVLKEWIVSVNPSVHVNAIRELADLGATHVVIHSAAENPLTDIEFYGKQVLPALGKEKLVSA